MTRFSGKFSCEVLVEKWVSMHLSKTAVFEIKKALAIRLYYGWKGDKKILTTSIKTFEIGEISCNLSLFFYSYFLFLFFEK